MKEGRLFENIPEFVEKAKELRKDKVEVLIEKSRVSKENPFEVLDGLMVLGADGSQIAPLKEFGIPLGGVQSAGVIVHHGKGYFGVKYLNSITSDRFLELERFRLEMEMIKRNLEKVDIAFYDGSLSALYFSEVSEKLLNVYRREIEELVNLSEKFETPVVAYSDRSFMRDLGFGVYDSFLLSEKIQVGEYTASVKTSSPLLAFYMKPNPSLPARVEFPEWCENHQKWIAEVIMAECRFGTTRGYPYILERAHKYAKISEAEKLAFVRAIKSSGISFKYLSKVI